MLFFVFFRLENVLIVSITTEFIYKENLRQQIKYVYLNLGYACVYHFIIY